MAIWIDESVHGAAMVQLTNRPWNFNAFVLNYT